MTEEHSLYDIERALAAYLPDRSADENSCIPESDLQELIARGKRSVRYDDMMEHLALCSRCWEALRTLRTASARAVMGTVVLQDIGGPIHQVGERLRFSNMKTKAASARRWANALLTEGFIEPSRSLQKMLSLARSVRETLPVPVVRSARVRPLSPVNTMVRTLPPVLTWLPVEGSEGYEILVLEQNREGSVVLWKGSPGVRTECRLPDEVTLHSDHLYLWQVIATVLGKKVRSQLVWFGSLSLTATTELQLLEEDYSESALILVGLYERYGLYEEAQYQLERLKALNTNNDLVRSMEQCLAQRPEILSGT